MSAVLRSVRRRARSFARIVPCRGLPRRLDAAATSRRPRHRLAAAAAAVALAAATGCGDDYAPLSLQTTGVPAQPLGQTLDLEVSLPEFFVDQAGATGLFLDLRLELSEGGPGRRDADYFIDGSVAAGGLMVEVEDRGIGETPVTLTPDGWSTGRIGPLQVGTMLFEMILTGTAEAGGRRVTGEARDSQTGRPGSFEGWSRHRFLVGVTDFAFTGRLAEVALVRESEIRVRTGLETISSDPVVRRSGRGLFVVNRLSFDNVQRVDPLADFTTAWQAGVGVGANPHDLVDVGDGRLYVSRFEPPFNDLAILDAATGVVQNAIPLGDLAENRDGTPRADRAVLVDETVFVALQDIDRTFSRYAEGKLAVIDAVRDAVVGVIPLGGKNPVDMSLTVDGDGTPRLWVALAGVFPGLLPQELSGGVVEIDLANRVVSRLVLDDDDAGGNVAALAMASDRLGWVVVSAGDFTSRVLAFDPTTGAILRTVFEATDLIPGIAVDGAGVLAIPDRRFASPGLCLYRVPADPVDGRETLIGCGPLDLPPLTLTALD